MKKTIAFSLFFFFGIAPIACGQSITFDWAAQMGSNLGEKGNSIVTDEVGNIYVTGQFAGTVDFQTGSGITNLTAAGKEDAFVVKLNPAGATLWAIQLGGLGTDNSGDIALDVDNNIYLTGYFEGTADFNPGPGTANMTAIGNYDMFIVKLNTHGALLWNKQTNTTAQSTVKGFSIALDANNNVLTTGLLQGTADFNPGAGTFNLTASSVEDCFVSKLTTDGNYIWAYRFGNDYVTSGGTSGQSIATDKYGYVYTGGSFSKTIDFNSGEEINNLTALGKTDAFVLKLHSDGTFIWSKQMGGPENDVLTSLSVDDASNIYCSGYFSATGDFDPGDHTLLFSSLGDEDVFITKINGQGDCLWAKSIGSSYSDMASSTALDRNGNVYVAGYFSSHTDFDPGAGTATYACAGFKDGFILKLTTSGNFSWVGGVNGNANEQIYAICVSTTGNIFSTGYFIGAPDFDPGSGVHTLTASNSSADVFVQMFNQILTLGLDDQQQFTKHLQVFPNPCLEELTLHFDKVYNDLNIKLISSSGQVLEEIINQSGDHFSMNLSSYSPGIYCVEIHSLQAVWRHKIIKP